MKTILLLSAVALACVAGTQTARAETDPLAAVKADVQKLVADATTLHDTVKADADKITADIQALQGTTDRKAARDTLQADWEQLLADGNRLRPAVEADWAEDGSEGRTHGQARLGRAEGAARSVQSSARDAA